MTSERERRELDRAVALGVLGLSSGLVSIDGPIWVAPQLRAGVATPIVVEEIAHYSSDIGAAWDVVEQLRADGWLVRVQEMPDGFPWLANGPDEPEMPIHRRAVCILHWMGARGERGVTNDDYRKRLHTHIHEAAATAAEAICRAALATVRSERTTSEVGA